MIRIPPLWLERAHLVVMYGLPLTWSWVSFLFHTYGTTEGWCDTRLVDENCNPFLFGIIMKFAWYGPMYLVLFLCCLTSIIAALRIRKWKRTVLNIKGSNSSLKLKDEVMTLIGYPIVYLLLTVFSLANAIYTAVDYEITTASLVLWYLHVVTSPFRGAVVAVVYAIDSCSRKWSIQRNKKDPDSESLLGPSVTTKVYSDDSWLKASIEESVSGSVKT